MFQKVILFLSVLFLVSACTTYSKRQCEEMNWGQEGYKKALEGESLTDVKEHYARNCFREHGIRPQFEGLEAGYKQGLEYFCTPEYAYQFSRRGGRYHGICPAKSEPTMMVRMNQGRVEYLEAKVSELENEVESKSRRISNLESELSAANDRANNCHH